MSTSEKTDPAVGSRPQDLQCALKEMREKIGLTRDELAELVDTTRTQIYRLEEGRQAPGIALALRLARVLDVAVERLWYVPSYENLGVYRTSKNPVRRRRGGGSYV